LRVRQVFVADEWVAGGQPEAAPSRLFWGSLRSPPGTPGHKLPEKLSSHQPPEIAHAMVARLLLQRRQDDLGQPRPAK
jgi:hypothetical protein